MTLWAIGMIVWAFFQMANNNPLVNFSQQMFFLGALAVLTVAADWASYQAVMNTAPRSS